MYKFGHKCCLGVTCNDTMVKIIKRKKVFSMNIYCSNRSIHPPTINDIQYMSKRTLILFNYYNNKVYSRPQGLCIYKQKYDHIGDEILMLL